MGYELRKESPIQAAPVIGVFLLLTATLCTILDISNPNGFTRSLFSKRNNVGYNAKHNFFQQRAANINIPEEENSEQEKSVVELWNKDIVNLQQLITNQSGHTKTGQLYTYSKGLNTIRVSNQNLSFEFGGFVGTVTFDGKTITSSLYDEYGEIKNTATNTSEYDRNIKPIFASVQQAINTGEPDYSIFFERQN